MEDALRKDLIVIVLEEVFNMHESYARKVAANSGLDRFKVADQEAYAAADHAVQRIEARCSKIEG